MQVDQAEQLRDAWARKGNPPCSHPSTDKEYFLGMDSGDRVCTTCGANFPMGKRPFR